MRSILIFLCLFPSILNAQVAIGLRDSKFAYIQYRINNIYIKTEHSLYSDKIKRQYIREYIGLNLNLSEKLNIKSSIYGGVMYNKYYADYGVFIRPYYTINTSLKIYAFYNLNYDTYIKRDNRFLGGFDINITKDIAFSFDYSSIPENRMNEKRLHGSILFHINNLYVKPSVSIPLDDKLHYIRFLTSFEYTFK